MLIFHQVDFHDVEARTLGERQRQEEKQKRLERIYKEKLERAKQEMEGKLILTDSCRYDKATWIC